MFRRGRGRPMMMGNTLNTYIKNAKDEEKMPSNQANCDRQPFDRKDRVLDTFGRTKQSDFGVPYFERNDVNGNFRRNFKRGFRGRGRGGFNRGGGEGGGYRPPRNYDDYEDQDDMVVERPLRLRKQFARAPLQAPLPRGHAIQAQVVPAGMSCAIY